MIITTTPTIEGHKILEYRGIVCGETILGANVFKDFMAGMSDFFGGRSKTYEAELSRAREIAISELQDKAHAKGANAIVGVDIDYEVLGDSNGMLMVIASGTAVVID